MLTNKQVVEKIKSAKNVAIFGHKNPDPDAYGSMFGMRDVCRHFGVKAEVFAVKNPKGYLDEIFPLRELNVNFSHENFDLVIFVDQHQISRTDEIFQEELKKSSNILIVDHHQIVPDDDVASDEFLITSEKSAASEILTQIIRDCEIKIDEKTATYLWAGIIGDTGRFLHSSLNASVLENAKFLLENGANAQFVYDNMYRRNSFKQFKLHGQYIKKTKLVCNGQGGYVIFRRRDFKKMKMDREDVKKYTQEIVNLEGVKVSALVIEYGKNDFKFSIRSNGVSSLPVVTHHGGGGHENACGMEKRISGLKIEHFTKKLIKEILNG